MPAPTGRRAARAARAAAPASAAVLAVAALCGCGGDAGLRTSKTRGAPAPGFTADTATRDGLATGAKASEAACRALPDGVWARTRSGRGECIRYAAAGAATDGLSPRVAVAHIGGDAPGIAYRFAGGRPQVEGAGEGYEMPAGARRRRAEALSGAIGGAPVFLVGRPGMDGSSGDHALDRHTGAEVELVDSALTELRRRYRVRGFVLSGFSSGGAIVANLLARRNDVACAVMASAPLDLAAFYRGPDGLLPDHYAMRAAGLADPMRTVGAAADAAAPTIVVLGDRRDRKVPPASWDAWVDAARRAGLQVSAVEVSGFDPAEPSWATSFHQTAAAATEAALACATGGPFPASSAGSPPPGVLGPGGAGADAPPPGRAPR